MSLKFIGKKIGMTQIFDDGGSLVPCTVLLAEPNIIVQIKTKEIDGYNAIQIGAWKLPKARLAKQTRARIGHFSKASVEPCRYLSESTVENTDEYQIGQSLDVGLFSDVSHVDITGISKGKGYQGVMKLHGFRGGPAAHGSGFHRHAGSTGMRSTPGRCLPGGPRASRMGNERITTQNLKVLLVDTEKNLILVEGSVSGCRNSMVFISPAIKKRKV